MKTTNNYHSVLVLSLALGLVMVVITVGNIFISFRCAESLDNFVKEVDDVSEAPIVCDTSAEIGVVLDIGLTLAGGLVGYLAATMPKKNEEEG